MAEARLQADAAPAELYWKYWQPRADAPDPRSYVLIHGGEIIAHAGIVPGACVIAGRRLTIFHIVDWVARADSAGAGVSLMKHVGLLADGLLAIGGSEQTQHILPHVGFTPCGTATAYVRPLRPLRILRGGGGPLGRRLGRTVRGAYWAATARRGGGGRKRWRVQLIGAEGVEALADVLGAGPAIGAVRLERSPQRLAYLLTCPLARMTLHGAERDGRMCGYFLLAHAKGQVRLADCRVASDEPADWQAVVQCAVDAARRHGTAIELAASTSDPMLADALEESGFKRRGALAVRIKMKTGSVVPPAALAVHMIDDDAAYLHARDGRLCA